MAELSKAAIAAGASAARRALLERVARSVSARTAPDVLRVGIDGVDGAGKTTFADELAAALTSAGRPVIRSGVDGFHHPRAIRYRRGRESPEGFLRDSYDYATLAAVLLEPLSPGGSRRYRRQVFDVEADRAVHAPEERAQPGAILLFDGIFLHRPELRAFWDVSIFLRVEWARNHRARASGGVNPPDEHQRRYAEGQALYFHECRPWEHATLVIDNDDLAAPFLVHRIERLVGSPAGVLDALVRESEKEGLRLLRRLVSEWSSGAERLEGPGEALFAAWQAGRAVGVCGLALDAYARAPGIGRVRHLYVGQAARRLGVGAALVREVIQAARGAFHMLRLRTRNPSAVTLYEGLGFRPAPEAADVTHVMELA
ncbi:MAG TPA: GNAT family N-acetyltransferase [Verrucomicrobiae bacterium]|jgi:uridine kinase|nr:GNAT family N-acetyltransferase [Verrucomicrobiae bacterium]